MSRALLTLRCRCTGEGLIQDGILSVGHMTFPRALWPAHQPLRSSPLRSSLPSAIVPLPCLQGTSRRCLSSAPGPRKTKVKAQWVALAETRPVTDRRYRHERRCPVSGADDERQYQVIKKFSRALFRKDAASARKEIEILNDWAKLSPRNVCSLAQRLEFIPVVSEDQCRDWDEIVNLAVKHSEALSANILVRRASQGNRDLWDTTSSITLVQGLARAIGLRQLHEQVPILEKVCQRLKIFPTDGLWIRVNRSSEGKLVFSKLMGRLIHMYLHTGKPNVAISLFESVPTDAISLTLLGVASSAYAATGSPDSVRKLMDLGVSLHLIPRPRANVYLNLALMNANSGVEGVHGAFDCLKETVDAERGFLQSPSTHSGLNSSLWTRMLRLCVEARNFTLAQEALQLSSELDIPLSASSVAPLLQLFRDQHGVNMAISLFESCMRHASESGQLGEDSTAFPPEFHFNRSEPRIFPTGLIVTPNVQMLATGIDLYARAKRLGPLCKLHAWALVQHRNKVYTLTSSYYLILIKAMNDHFGYDCGLKVVQEMLELCIAMHPAAFANMAAHASKRDRSFADDLRRLQASARYDVHKGKINTSLLSTDVSWTHRIHETLRKGNLADALDILQKMTESDHARPTASIISLFLEHFAARGEAEAMEAMIRRGELLGLPLLLQNPNIWAICLKGYSFARKWDRAFALWDENIERGIIPILQTQSSILDACGFSSNRSRLDEVVATLEKAPWGGTKINVWTSAIEAYLRLRSLDGALRIVEEVLLAKGLSGDRKFFGTLITVRVDVNRQYEDPRVMRHIEAFGVKNLDVNLSRMCQQAILKLRRARN